MCAFMHRQGATAGSDQDQYCTGGFNDWHIATVEWTPTACRFILDGTVMGTSTSRIPDTSMHWVLQTETNVTGGAPADTVDGNVQIDWVTMYAPA